MYKYIVKAPVSLEDSTTLILIILSIRIFYLFVICVCKIPHSKYGNVFLCIIRCLRNLNYQ